MQSRWENGILTLVLPKKIDAVNAPAVEAEIREYKDQYAANIIVFDFEMTEYISSAGLRVILRLKNEGNDIRLIQVQPAIYEILEMTGFTEMMEVSKAYRLVSLEGCELIGQGANGKIYRLDRENIIKVYTNTNSLAEIHHERELARAAFVSGVPTAIPYDVVRIKEGGYGSIYEMLNAKTYIQLYKDGEKSLEELTELSVDLLKRIHSLIVKQSIVPDIRESALSWAMFLKDYLPEEPFEKLIALFDAVPIDNHMIHGDYHFRNIMVQNGESLLIDMDRLSRGHPIFDLAAMYNAYCGFGCVDPGIVETFLGIPYTTAAAIWRRSLECYLDTRDEKRLQEAEDKVRIISYTRIARHWIRRNGLETETGRQQTAGVLQMLQELLPHTDSLLF